LSEQIEGLTAEATIELSSAILVAYAFQVSYCNDCVRSLCLFNDSPRYRVNLMPHRALLTVPPFPDDAGLADGAAEAEVVSSNRPHLFAVEAWVIILNGCGELTDAHVYRQNCGIRAFQACLLLNGYVHIPFIVFSAKQLAFT
jgi:hypothetical protein